MNAPTPTERAVLDPAQWAEQQERHAARVEPWIAPRLQRRARGQRHPVDDFLFDYYSYRPGQLRRWHPGVGVMLAGTPAQLGQRMRDPEYEHHTVGITASRDRLQRHQDRLHTARAILVGTASREPRLGCFGLHEWAMVYRVPTAEVRHDAWPMRLTADEIADTVEAQGLRCTHIDAYRFYSPAAEPLNELVPTRATQALLEQPGCLHATMDLYKWAFLFSPFTTSDLIADAFELAVEVRAIDMRSSPYDFASLGLEPIRVETPEGRREFVAHQRDFAARGAALRQRVLTQIDALIALVPGAGASSSAADPGSARNLGEPAGVH